MRNRFGREAHFTETDQASLEMGRSRRGLVAESGQGRLQRRYELNGACAEAPSWSSGLDSATAAVKPCCGLGVTVLQPYRTVAKRSSLPRILASKDAFTRALPPGVPQTHANMVASSQ